MVRIVKERIIATESFMLLPIHRGSIELLHGFGVSLESFKDSIYSSTCFVCSIAYWMSSLSSSPHSFDIRLERLFALDKSLYISSNWRVSFCLSKIILLCQYVIVKKARPPVKENRPQV